MKFFGRLLVSRLEHGWKVREYIQRELRFQSSLSVLIFGACAWLLRRDSIQEHVKNGLFITGSNGESGVNVAGLEALAPIGITAFGAGVQVLWILCALGDHGYQLLPPLDELWRLHQRTRIELEDEETGESIWDESRFIAKLRSIQLSMATANTAANDRRIGHLGRSSLWFYFCLFSLAFTAAHYGTQWVSILVIHILCSVAFILWAFFFWGKSVVHGKRQGAGSN